MMVDTDDQIRKAVSELEVERAETIENLRIEVVELKDDVVRLEADALRCPECGTVVVRCSEAGVAAISRLAEDEAREPG